MGVRVRVRVWVRVRVGVRVRVRVRARANPNLVRVEQRKLGARRDVEGVVVPG